MTVAPLDASTVILLRRTTNKATPKFEVLMVLRNSKSVFVPSAYVFPGGKVERDDCLPNIENYCNKDDLVKAKSVLEEISSSQAALGIWIAAIRETFEEAGLLLAYKSDGTIPSFSHEKTGQKLREYRTAINNGNFKFVNMLKKENFMPAFDRLHYFSHWITPELSPLRYDTRFFVTEMPENQNALHDGDEVIKHVWINPAQALQKHSEQKFFMVAPTIVTLEELCQFETIEEVIGSTKNKKVKATLTHMTFEKNEIQEQTPDGRIFRAVITSD